MKKNDVLKIVLLISLFIIISGCTEKPMVFSIDISDEEIKAGTEAGESSIVIESNYRWEVCSTMPEWITVEPISSEAGRRSVMIKYTSNAQDDDRSFTISFKSGEIQKSIIIRQPARAIFRTNTKIIDCSEFGETFKIPVQTNKACTPYIVNGDGWLAPVTSKALSDKEFTFTVSPLSSDIERKADIIFKDAGGVAIDTIIVRQSTKKYRYRSILLTLYKSTGGDNWTNNTNWNSDKPFREWYGVETYGNDIIKLDLSHNNLKGTIPPDISGLTELTSLKLWFNELGGNIPAELSSLTKLEELILSGNSFSGKFPEAMYSMKTLKYLTLSYLSINFDLSKAVNGLASLRQLYLDYVPLNTVIPAEISKLSDITQLSMRSCGLYGPIPEELYTLKHLESLALDNNEINGQLSSSVANLKKITNLSLANNVMSGRIPVQICALKELSSLMLFYNNFEGALPYALKFLPNWNKIIAENGIYQQKNSKMLTHSGYVVGDIYYGGSDENSSPLGIVYRLNSADGTPLEDQDGSSQHFSVLYLYFGNNFWSTNYEDTGADDIANGSRNCQELTSYINSCGINEFTYPALRWSKTISTSTSQDWYIPAPEESIDIHNNITIIDTMLKIAGNNSGLSDAPFMTSYDGPEKNRFALSIKSSNVQLTWQDKASNGKVVLIMKK
ncbi:MAG: BACON domain-containing carbohydrate-binding protein [Rikenellaceae bacterium]|nr:BACON domain-containing carbohydrate-binding protein [Rikenellaceae bacterium]